MNGPIFIVGAPRSGTTLLRNMLNRHPAIALCDETYFEYYVYRRRRAFGDLADESRRRLLTERYLALRRIARLPIDRGALAAALNKKGDTYREFFCTLLAAFAATHGKPRWGEKTPQHTAFAPTLCVWYPDCALIHLVRDPRDVVASLLQMPWGRRSVTANARAWHDCVRAARTCAKLPNYLQVRYEDLVQNPPATLERICAFIGEAFDPAMLSVRSDPSTAAPWWFDRARESVTTERIELWRQHLTEEQTAAVEGVAGPLLVECGYRPAGTTGSGVARARLWLDDRVDDVRFRLEQIPRMAYYWLAPRRLAAEEAWIDRNATGQRR